MPTRDSLPDLPPALERLLPPARWESVSHGESGAVVWLSAGYALKVAARTPLERPLQAERDRLLWLVGRVPVPSVLGHEITPDAEFLLTTRLPGLPMHHPDILRHPGRVVSLLARALRELHALPAQDCPFDASLRLRLRQGRERVEAGVVDEADFDAERRGWSGARVLEELRRTRPAGEKLVVTHGDPCLPNLLVSGEHVEGFIDVGRAGLADRHADLALAHRSPTRNLGAEAAGHFLEVYGLALVDEEKLAYYRLLDELF
ncbi:MAG: APH(3') family aminoglycoside O-phosphotransferase [Deinococcus sp.]